MLRDPEHGHGTHLSLSLRKSINHRNLPVSSVADSIARGVDPGVGGRDPLKICRRGQSMF